MFDVTRAFSTFSVNDLAKAEEFYGKVLELKVRMLSNGFLEIPLASNKVLIYSKPNHQAAIFTILTFPVSDIEATVDKLIARGVVFEQYDAPLQTNEKGICKIEGGPKIAWFKDPSGNILAVLQEQ